jgi:hypothetical protein
VFLTKEEERVLSGYEGEAKRLAMELVVRVGEALGAPRLVKVSHAHVSGISYDNIGEEGLQFIRELVELKARVSVFSTFNPAGVPLELDEPYNPLKSDPHFVSKQLEIVAALEKMGFVYSATCTPYELRPPKPGEHLAWGESSAVAVANTLYGAKTNREGGPIALAAAIVGRTYYWGLHVPENRRANSMVVVYTNGGPLDELYAGLLGYLVGEALSDTVPYVRARFRGKKSIISLCAASAASGNIGMCIVEKVSPDDRGPPLHPVEKLTLEMKDLERKREEISTASLDEAELFFTGCPHHGVGYVYEILDYMSSKGYSRLTRPMWIAVRADQREVRELARRLAEKNIFLLPGTCLVVSRFQRLASAIATDSLKSAFYLPRRHGVRVALSTAKAFVDSYGV